MNTLKNIMIIGLLSFAMFGAIAQGENGLNPHLKTPLPIASENTNDTNDSNKSRHYLSPIAGANTVVEPGDIKNCVDLTRFDSYPDYTIVWTVKSAPKKAITRHTFTNYTISHSEEKSKGIGSGQQRKSYNLKLERKDMPGYFMDSSYNLETDDYTIKRYNGVLMRAVTKNTRHLSNTIIKYDYLTSRQPNATITTRYVPYRLFRVKTCVGSILKQTYTEDREDHGYLVEYYNKVIAIGEKKCVKAGCFNTLHEHEIFKNNSGTSDTQVWIDLKTGVLVRVVGNMADAELTYIDQ